ncbi:MAG: glycosyltransferase [Gammaproteobacteria bacterium]
MNQPDPLRILLVIETCGGGSGRHTLDLLNGLIERGHAVELAYSPVRAEEWFETAIANTSGLIAHRIEMHRKPGLSDLGATRALRKLFVTRGPFDVVHGHSSKAGALIRLASIGFNHARIYTPHALVTLDPELNNKKKVLFGIIERILDPLGDAVICVSEEEHQHACELGLKASSLVVVHNGLGQLPSVDRSELRLSLGLGKAAICLGCVGRFSDQKAMHRLMDVFLPLHKELKDAHLVLVGDGPELITVKAEARRRSIEDRVHFTGHADGIGLMAAFDIFVGASLYEAFPYVFLEAAARGLPLVFTEVGGTQAMIKDGVNGYVIPQHDLPLMSERLNQLCRNRDLREQMAASSLALSGGKTLDTMVEQTLEVYRAVLANKR